jgi:hypothetical protein
MSAGNSSIILRNTKIPSYLLEEILIWDDEAEVTFVDIKRKRTLKDMIEAQWKFFDSSIQTCRSIDTDSLTLQVWASQILSPQDFNIEPLEKDCKTAKEEVDKILKENSKKLIETLQDVKRLVEKLHELTGKYIDVKDTRFTPALRWEQNNARNVFKRSELFKQLGPLTSTIDNVLNELQANIIPQEQQLNYILHIVSSLSEEARIILVLNYEAIELTTVLEKFNEAVTKQYSFEKGEACKKLHQELNRKSRAKYAKQHCLITLPNIVAKCDAYYTSSLI